MKKPLLKEIRGNPVWLRLRKKYPGKKIENLEEEGKKEEIKEIEEEERRTKQGEKGKTKSEEVEYEENHGEPKAGENSLRDVIIQDENGWGGETARDEGLRSKACQYWNCVNKM